jgi:hypothetical protein
MRQAAAFTALSLAVTMGPLGYLMPHAGAVSGGSPDGSAHPYVAELIPPGGSQPTCTAVLVHADNGATVALTDAHCLYRNGHRNGTGVRLSFTSTWSTIAPTVGGKWYIEPSYNPSVSQQHDVAGIVLAGPPPVHGAYLANVGYTGNVATGSSLLAVGTGQPYSGERRQATEILSQRAPTWLYLAPGSGNTCTGDSGGPDLLPGTSAVLALTDQGSCSYDQDTRMDTGEMHWLAQETSRWPTLVPTMSVHLSSTQLSPGQALTVTGETSGVYSGDTIVLQRYQVGSYQTVASSYIGVWGGYRLTYTPSAPGVFAVRVTLVATATHPAGSSGAQTVTAS